MEHRISPNPMLPFEFKNVMAISAAVFLIMLLGVILRGCETREQSYQACIATHEPVQCAAADAVRNQ